MNGRGSIYDWTWEITDITLRKSDEYGKPYSAILRLRVINGEAYAEGLHADEFTRQDRKTIQKIIESFGYTSCTFVRYKENVCCKKKLV